jgi:hypothetical protein
MFIISLLPAIYVANGIGIVHPVGIAGDLIILMLKVDGGVADIAAFDELVAIV